MSSAANENGGIAGSTPQGVFNPYASPRADLFVAGGAASAGISGVRPHRGTRVFVLGMISLIAAALLGAVALPVALPVGIISVVMARLDLKRMFDGSMESSGRGITQAGMICGLVGIAFSLFSAVIMVIVFGVVYGIEFLRRLPS